MVTKRTEKGQALVLIAFAAIVLFAFAALAIDGSRVYSAKRHAQNAADTSALAGALAYTRATNAQKADNTIINGIIVTAAENRALSNGYANGGANEVTITATDVPDCPGDVDGKDITVKIVFHQNTTFARVFGRTEVTNAVTATSRACGFYYAPLFDGAAVVGLNSGSECGFNTGNSGAAHWDIQGSGIFSNGCAHAKDIDSVTFDPGSCAEAVGSVTGFSCNHPNQAGAGIDYPEDILKIMPPNPCTGAITGNRYAGGGIIPTAGQLTFNDGVYCIADMMNFRAENVTLNNATLFVTDQDFNLKYAGDGGFFGTPTRHGGYAGSDPYEDYYMIIDWAKDGSGNIEPCSRFTDNSAQVIEWRGNGTGTFYGTILAPTACIDLRGNGTSDAMHTQLIAYIVGSNGDADVLINYQQDENHENPVYPTISLRH